MAAGGSDDGDTALSQDKSGSRSNDRELQPILQPAVLGAFIAGLALANFNRNLLMGFIVGCLGGTYVEQNYPNQLPNVMEAWNNLKRKWHETRNS
jgi:hypothetical protein